MLKLIFFNFKIFWNLNKLWNIKGELYKVFNLSQDLPESIFIIQIAKRFSNIMLLWPGHSGNLPTRVLVNLMKGHQVGCVFYALFLKNERQACDHRVWLLEWPQTPLVQSTAKSGTPAKLKFQWTRFENLKTRSW